MSEIKELGELLEEEILILKAEIERISKERDEAKERYAALVEAIVPHFAVDDSATDPRD